MYFLFCKQIVNHIHSFDNSMFKKIKKIKNKRKMSKYMLYLNSKVKEGSNNQLFLQIYEDKGGVKMKGNKRLLVLAVLLLLVTVTFTTYAIYKSSTTANGTLQAAAWSVKVNNTDIESVNYTFTGADIQCGESNPAKVEGKIAPGAECYINIPVDATGSEVDVVLTAEVGTVTGLPDGMTVEVDGGASKTIAYSTETDAMKTNVKLNIVWPGELTDTDAKNTTDKAAAGKSISIPVTLTARQGL